MQKIVIQNSKVRLTDDRLEEGNKADGDAGQGVQLPLLQWHQLLVNEYGNQTWVFSLLI